MGDVIIRDPNNQDAMKVAKDGRGKVGGWQASREHIVSIEKGLAFSATTVTDALFSLTLSTTRIPILLLKNTSTTKNLVIEKIIPSSDVAAQPFVIKKNMDIGSLTNNVSNNGNNLRFSSGNIAETQVEIWDEVDNTVGIGGLTGGIVIAGLLLPPGVAVFPIDGAIILGAGDNIVLEAGGIGGEFTIIIRFYFVSMEE